MLRMPKVLAGVMALLFFAALFPVAGWASTYGQVEHATSCHHRLPVVPAAPARHSHECCAAGHHWVIPGSPSSIRPCIALGEFYAPVETIQAIAIDHSPLKSITDSPPMLLSLRI